MSTRRTLTPEQRLDDALADAETYLKDTISDLKVAVGEVLAELEKARTGCRVQRMNLARKAKALAARGGR
jgi:hypothetical protein